MKQVSWFIAVVLLVVSCVPAASSAIDYTISEAAQSFGLELQNAVGADTYIVRVGDDNSYIYDLETDSSNAVAVMEGLGQVLASHQVERPIQLEVSLGMNDTDILGVEGSDGRITLAITAPRTRTLVDAVRNEYKGVKVTSWGKACVPEDGLIIFSLVCTPVAQ